MVTEEYIQEKIQEAHEYKIKDEESAKNFIKKMNYIHYLHGDDEYWSKDPRFKPVEIQEFDKLLAKERNAWEIIEDEDFIFEHIIYPLHHKIWKGGFEYLRSLEKTVIRGEISKKQYAIMIQNFNEFVLADLNEEASKHGKIKHTAYWIQSLPLKIDLKQQYEIQ